MSQTKKETRYEAALKAVLKDSDTTESAYALVALARECDQLVEQQQRGALEMARRFTEYAERVAEPLYDVSSPMGYSTLIDISRNEGELRARRAAFWMLTRTILGKAAIETLRASLEAVRS